MTVFPIVESFLKNHCSSSSPVLLALSGGADSLCLFYCLLMYRDRYSLPFHIAHVDHGWREESQHEAQMLKQLAIDYQVPFYLKTLNFSSLKGNLEAICREARYNFFAELDHQMNFQGVLIGHHLVDQAETVCKRVLEGAHWSCWVGLKLESWRDGMRILRPLLSVTKQEIRNFLTKENKQPFEDSTNYDLRFLRARLRERIFPWLNQEFGKQVERSFIEISREAQELVDYFEKRLTPLIDQLIEGPWGLYLNLQTKLPFIEIKYLLRLLCRKNQFFLSREIIEQAALALQMGKANQLFVMGNWQIWVDRGRLFILPSLVKREDRKWKMEVKEEIAFSASSLPCWEEGWRGFIYTYLPLEEGYTIGYQTSSLFKERWRRAKIPSFLWDFFPLIYRKGEIYHEFLTGQLACSLHNERPCLRMQITYEPT